METISYIAFMKNTDLRTASKEVREDIRKRAIRMLEQGKTLKEISEILVVNKNSLTKWKSDFKKGGYEGLKEIQRGVKQGDNRLLSPAQEEKIQKIIVDKMPDQLKMPFGLWTRAAVKDLIKREFGINVAIRTMGDYLKRWGFSPQKPKLRAYEQNPKAVERWLKEEYPSISELAKKENAVIHWGDETGIRNDCQHGRSYAPKGQTPVRLKMAKRISTNMISTVTNQGMVRFMIYSSNMNSAVLITFLKRLIKGSAKKIFLILDNLRVHHSKLVKEWVEKHKDEIALYFLPSYSPESNPDEYLNCDLKLGLSRKPSPKDEKQMKKHVRSHMRLLQRRPKRVANYFKHNSIKYAAA